MRTELRPAALAGPILLGLLAGPAAGLEPAHLVADFPRGQAVLETGGPRCLVIDVYFASTPAQRAQGLMYVDALDEFEGMYFGYRTPSELVMWMKNTVLSLDMLFIRPDGAVGSIARNTEPFSTTRISSGGEVIGVLELNAGFTRRWRVEPGTRLFLP
ncbi:MAG: DUF192 domain-containing protein [Chromatiales bacterium]|nr:DUF192 domain-containing protein [Chromatiales bacterium]